MLLPAPENPPPRLPVPPGAVPDRPPGLGVVSERLAGAGAAWPRLLSWRGICRRRADLDRPGSRRGPRGARAGSAARRSRGPRGGARRASPRCRCGCAIRRRRGRLGRVEALLERVGAAVDPVDRGRGCFSVLRSALLDVDAGVLAQGVELAPQAWSSAPRALLGQHLFDADADPLDLLVELFAGALGRLRDRAAGRQRRDRPGSGAAFTGPILGRQWPETAALRLRGRRAGSGRSPARRRRASAPHSIASPLTKTPLRLRSSSTRSACPVRRRPARGGGRRWGGRGGCRRRRCGRSGSSRPRSGRPRSRVVAAADEIAACRGQRPRASSSQSGGPGRAGPGTPPSCRRAPASARRSSRGGRGRRHSSRNGEGRRPPGGTTASRS